MQGQISRWLRAAELQNQALAAKAAGDDGKAISLFDQCFRVLEGIASDPESPKDDREKAAAILEDVRVHFRASTPTMLRSLAQVAGDPTADPALRAGATKMLKQAAERLPTLSDKIH